jgi:hypothetical protein
MSRDDVLRVITNSTDAAFDPPLPLMRKLPPADPFPVDALGPILGAAARAIHDRVKAPIAIGAPSVLGAATLAVQGHADVVLPIGNGQSKPVSCYLVTIAETGERKSACDTEALWPVRKHEAKLREKYEKEFPDHLNDKLAWERARDAAVKRGKGNRTAIKDALDALGPMPSPPLTPMLTCPEPNFEGLCRLFATGLPSLGIFTTEAGQFIGGNGMAEDNKLKTAAGLSSLWDGEAIRRVRSGDGASILPGRRLAAHLMAQPIVADVWLRDRLLAGQGLFSRILVTAPDSAAGTRLHRPEQSETDRDLKRYGTRLPAILEKPLQVTGSTRNELQPRSLQLSAQSARLWIAFADHVEAAISPGGSLEPIRGLANKLPEHAARLAGVLTVTGDIEAVEIAAPEMEAGIALAEHYAAEALRLIDAGRINEDLRLAQRFLDWLHNSWKEEAISLPDMYQRSLNAIGDKATASKIAGILEAHNHLVKIPGGATVAGQYRRDAWRIVCGG